MLILTYAFHIGIRCIHMVSRVCTSQIFHRYELEYNMREVNESWD